MRIAIDVRSLMEGRHSGVEEYTIQVTRALAGLGGHELIAFYNSWREVALPDLGVGVEVRGWGYPNKVFNAVQLVGRWPRWDRLMDADVFFVPNPRLLPVAPTTPYVVTVHDLSFERFPEFYSRRRRWWHRLVQARHLVENADHVIAVSEATRDDVCSLYGVPEERVSVVYSGVVGPGGLGSVISNQESELGDQSPAATDRLFSKPLPKRYVLYLGTLEPRKNVISLVEAFSAIAGDVPHDLVLAGERGWLMEEVERAIAASPVQGRIHRLGVVSEEEKWALYAGADLFVYPSFYEGFGFPPLEALLAGTPVVTSHNSALPEVVGEWATLVDPYNVAELALVIEELLRDPPLVADAVRQEIQRRFSWERAARETVDLLEKVI